MTRFVLTESQLPTAWFNILPRMAEPLEPPLELELELELEL